MKTAEILEQFKSGKLDLETALAELQGFQDLGHSRVDLAREDRNGTPEVIYGEGKTPQQISEIMQSMANRQQNILVTRLESESADQLCEIFPETTYNPLARVLTHRHRAPYPANTKVALICAGTSDLPVAEEARLTLEFYGNPVETVYDAGVAGLHRLMASVDTIRTCRVVIVVAGMEGALPSVVGGLVNAPVIAVPTSVGYGSSFDGLSALLGMLNSCASGLSVVNIDNGFGAGFLANRINRL
ncbi:MAG: N5-carboxyaminoimidazole ribonucleotide mutase [Opitutia bacterium UBA7350]|nr:MAG: N5-carboxyaminoimidazole ribonucleotide mutase [Opitutae bacterium UBA7350]